MINTKQMDRLIEKVAKAEKIYADFLVNDREEVAFGIYEASDGEYAPPPPEKYRSVRAGERWGKPFSYAWFGADLAIPERMRGKRVYLECETGAFESLAFVNGKPYGMFDYVEGRSERLHRYLPLDFDDADVLRLDVESYASHRYAGTQPYETPVTFGKESLVSEDREYCGFWLVTFDEVVEKFTDDLRLLNSLYRSPIDEFLRAELAECYARIYKKINLMPSEEGIDRDGLAAACRDIERTVFEKEKKKGYRAGLVGHSHLDTAWLWPVEETKRKAARTASTAVRLLKRFGDYRFIMSSVVYLDWFKRYYPSLFGEIAKLTSEGRFEPNGAVWVECDCNLTGGEAMVRQFLYGQRFLRRELGVEADCFWLPDTFGYSAALPQIMRKSNVKYFYTTKLSWNDTNRFPYDTFRWEGMDGTEVVAHFNCTHCFADPQKIAEQVGGIQNKFFSDKKLIAYGYGDGGGGPSEKMADCAIKSERIRGIPAAKHVSIGQFMRELDKKNLPSYAGELYLELHRGTLTTLHRLKELNRKFEIALHDLEWICATRGRTDLRDECERLYKTLLVNQFHDILPGTSMNEVNEQALSENERGLREAKELALKILNAKQDGDSVTFVNTLGFSRKDFAVLDGEHWFDGTDCYTFTDFDGKQKTGVRVALAGFSSVTLRRSCKPHEGKGSAFVREGNKLKTPYMEVEFDENMFIVGLYDRRAGRQVARGKLNELLLYRDIPCGWDNWDIDADYAMRGEACRLLRSETVNDNVYEYRIRSVYQVGEKSVLTQDMIFPADDAWVDFRSEIDWREKHRLLKARFDTNVFSRTMKNEIQFGYIERSLLRNTSEEQAKFEVCNHKWTDISENRFGFTLINDCKYGVGGTQGCLSLSLMKGGTHPDTTGDEGVRRFNYKILLHGGSFCCESVIQRAYEYNYPPMIVKGATEVTPIVRCDGDGVMIETVKLAEEGDGVVVRLYECEGNHVSASLNFGRIGLIRECNLLEDETRVIGKAQKVEVSFDPFEIKTLKISWS